MASHDEKARFILDWIGRKPGGVSALDEAFQDAYHERFGVARTFKLWGAMPCPDAARTLLRMYRSGMLHRWRVGIPLLRGQGFPSWVYHYDLFEKNDHRHELQD